MCFSFLKSRFAPSKLSSKFLTLYHRTGVVLNDYLLIHKTKTVFIRAFKLS